MNASCALAHADYERSVGKITLEDGRELKIVRHFTDGIFYGDPVQVIVKSETNERDFVSTEFVDEVAIRFIQNSLVIYTYGSILKSPVATKIQKLEGLNLIDVTDGWSKATSPIVLVWDHALTYSLATLFFLFFLILIYAAVHKVRSSLAKKKWLLLGVIVTLISFECGYLVYLGVMGVSPIMTSLLSFATIALIVSTKKLSEHLRDRYRNSKF